MGFAVPDMIASHFHMRAGDRIADLGAGSGHFINALSRLVGEEGKVLAVDIQRQLAEGISARARAEKVSNVESIWGDLESLGGTKITEKSLDAAMLSNTLSLIQDKKTALAECVRILRKGGKLFVIDWRDSFGANKAHAEMIVSEEAAKKIVADAGFMFERTFPAGEHHYGLAFRLS